MGICYIYHGAQTQCYVTPEGVGGASLVAQLVKNPPAMQETCVWSLGWEEPRRREKLPTPVFWPRELHGLYGPWCCKESDTTEWLSLAFVCIFIHVKKCVFSIKYNLQFFCSLVEEDKFQCIKLDVMLRTPSSYGFSQGSPAFPALSAVSSPRYTYKNDC